MKQIESSYQRMSHIEIHDHAIQLGFYVKDLFVLVQQRNPLIQYSQQHARKKHSYLWVFKKPSQKTKKELNRFGLAKLT